MAYLYIKRCGYFWMKGKCTHKSSHLLWLEKRHHQEQRAWFSFAECWHLLFPDSRHYISHCPQLSNEAKPLWQGVWIEIQSLTFCSNLQILVNGLEFDLETIWENSLFNILVLQISKLRPRTWFGQVLCCYSAVLKLGFITFSSSFIHNIVLTLYSWLQCLYIFLINHIMLNRSKCENLLYFFYF